MQLIAVVFGQIWFALDGDPATALDFSVIVASFVTFIALLKARDNDVSSEKAGAPDAMTVEEKAEVVQAARNISMQASQAPKPRRKGY